MSESALRADGLVEQRLVVLPEWIDSNGHLNDAAFFRIFSRAVDAMLGLFGVQVPGPDGLTVITAETHIRYLREGKLGDPLLVVTRVLDLDEKRVHTWQELHNPDSSELLATAEWMTLHADISVPKTVPFPADVYSQLKALHARHYELPLPEGVGRTIGIRRR